jgi:hypothetical protein
MEQAQQTSGQQQGRQQPVYDTRQGGHYGNYPFPGASRSYELNGNQTDTVIGASAAVYPLE